MATVNEFAIGVIKECKQRKIKEMENSNDVLLRFILKGAFSDKFLRDIIISFMLVRCDTMSSVVAWFLCLVATRLGV